MFAPVRLLLCLTLLATASVPAPALAGEDAAKAHADGGAHRVWGWVQAAGPVRDATIRLVSLDGTMLKRARRETYRTGTFFVQTSRLPRKVEVQATGGMLSDGSRFHGTLRLRANLRKQGGIVHLNPITTVIAAYRDLVTDASARRAARAVKHGLGIPRFMNIGEHARVDDSHFSGHAFLEAAQAAGGFDRYVNRVARKIVAGERFTFPSGRYDLASAVTDGAVWLLKNLATGAVSSLGGKGMDYVLNAFGLTSGSNDSAQLTQIQDQLNNITQDLTSGLAALSSGIAQVDSDVRQGWYAADRSNIENIVSSYISSDDAHPSAGDEGAFERMSYMANVDPTDAAALANAQEDFGQFVANTTRDFLDQPDTLNTALVSGGDQSEGLLQVWRKAFTTNVRFWDDVTQAGVEGIYAYYETKQTQLLAVLSAFRQMEEQLGWPYSKATQTDGNWKALNISDLAKKYNGDVEARLANQQSQLQGQGWQTIPAGFLIDTKQDLMWSQVGDLLAQQRGFADAQPDDPYYENARDLLANEINGPYGIADLYPFAGDFSLPTSAQYLSLVDGWGSHAGSIDAYMSNDLRFDPSLVSGALWTSTTWADDCNDGCIIDGHGNQGHLAVVPTDSSRFPTPYWDDGFHRAAMIVVRPVAPSSYIGQ